mmetsp:Transcript_7366/g.12633  ORF Transcript_7366/g.12633 Transcript_7366/m.12633 type:complete len:96 (+) Transcript_7366:293-580(+)
MLRVSDQNERKFQLLSLHCKNAPRFRMKGCQVCPRLLSEKPCLTRNSKSAHVNIKGLRANLSLSKCFHIAMPHNAEASTKNFATSKKYFRLPIPP